VRRVEGQPFGLPIRTAIAACVGTLIPVQAEPPQIAKDRVFRLPRGSLGVRVLDAEDERPGGSAGEQPVEEPGPRVADLQLPGRARVKSDSHVAAAGPGTRPSPSR